MSFEIILPAWETKLGNAAAKSMLWHMADQANPDGVGSMSIQSLHERTEIGKPAIPRRIRLVLTLEAFKEMH